MSHYAINAFMFQLYLNNCFGLIILIMTKEGKSLLVSLDINSKIKING